MDHPLLATTVSCGRKLGVLERIFDALSSAYDGDLQMLDSSSIRVHQHAANVKKGAQKKRTLPLGVTLTPGAGSVSWELRSLGQRSLLVHCRLGSTAVL
jgi:hypothetical protein